MSKNESFTKNNALPKQPDKIILNFNRNQLGRCVVPIGVRSFPGLRQYRCSGQNSK